MDNRVKELLEKVKSTAGAMGSAASNTARQAGKYAGEMLDIAKLNLRIFDLNSDITPLLKEIGQMVYDTHIGVEVDDSIIEEKLSVIEEKKEKIAQLQREINALKKSKPCPRCGAICSKGDAFCKKCGMEL